MKSKVLTRLTCLTLFASVFALTTIAPAALADIPTQRQLIAAQPISQAGLRSWMPQEIAARLGPKLYINKTKTDKGIRVHFAYTDPCSGTYCSAGSITFSKNDFEANGQPVELANGITGYIIRGASITNIVWQQGELNYQLNFKLSPDDLVTYANFVIKQMEKQQG